MAGHGHGMNPQQMAQLQALMAQAQAERKALVEFRAGILHQTGVTVTADPRRGKLRLIHGPEDGLVHLQWVLRPSDTVELDVLVMPQSATYEKVTESKGGRVYLLKFKGSNPRKVFFWMQEPKDDKDEELAKQVRDTINNPPPAPNNGLQDMMQDGGMDEQAQLMQMMGGDFGGGMGGFGGSGSGSSGSSRSGTGATGGSSSSQAAGRSGASTGASRAAATTGGSSQSQGAGSGSGNTGSGSGASGSAGSGAGGLDPSALAALAGLAQRITGGQGQGRAGQQGGQGGEHKEPLSMTELLDAERTAALVDPDMVERLAQFLPEGQRSAADIRAQLRSPQIQQTLDRVTAMLHGSQFGSLMSSLGLPVTGDMGVPGLVAAIEADVKRQREREAKDGKTTGAAQSRPAGSGPAATSGNTSGTSSQSQQPSSSNNANNKPQDPKKPGGGAPKP